MVSLEWSGKKAVVNHHLDVKYRLLCRTLPAFDGPKLIFGERCMMSPERRKRERITFRQIP